VTGGNERFGRRDNGLFATDYAVVADVDPRVGEHLLDVLGNRGIAAYLQPTSDQHPITRLTTLPGRPTDRLFVDKSELDTARGFLDVLMKDDAAPATPPVNTGTDFEDAWASIVAGYDRAGDTDTTPWPASEDVNRSATTTEPPREYPRWRAAANPGPDDGSLLSGLDSFGAGLPDADDDDEEYHPPTPPPLPRFAFVTIVSVIGVIAGITIVADPNLLPMSATEAAMLGCAAVLAGAVGLIGRLRSGNPDDEDNDPGNGAIV
jgi:hypothetical protein